MTGSGCTGGATGLGTGGAATGMVGAGIGTGSDGALDIGGGIAWGCGAARVTAGPILFFDSSSLQNQTKHNIYS